MIGGNSLRPRNLMGLAGSGTNGTSNVLKKGFDNRLKNLQSLRSSNGRYVLLLRNGKLLLEDELKNRLLWDGGKEEPGDKAYLVLQTDGNMVLYGSDGKPLAASNTAGSAGDCVALMDNGMLALLTAGPNRKVIWFVDPDNGMPSLPKNPVPMSEADMKAMGLIDVVEKADSTVPPPVAVSPQQGGNGSVQDSTNPPANPPANPPTGPIATIQGVRKDMQDKIKEAAEGLDDKAVANAMTAGWEAWKAKYCPTGKATEACPYPQTYDAAVAQIQAALEAGDRDAIVGVSTVDDGQYPLTEKSVAAINVFMNAVATRLNTMRAIAKCVEQGMTYDEATNKCIKAESGNWMKYALAAAAAWAFFG